MSDDAVAVQTVHVRIPAQIRRLYGASAQEQVQAATVRNLVRALDAGERAAAERAGTLLGVFDRTQTPMGARLLRHWLLAPLLDKGAIDARLDAVRRRDGQPPR